MNVSDAGLKLIAEFEGFSDRLYDDPVGHATIGYGFLIHLGNFHRIPGACAACDRWKNGVPGAITPAQGRKMLREKVKAYADAVARYTAVTLTQSQCDALTSFTYNGGQGGYQRSSVRKAVNSGGDVGVELRKYIRGTNGVTYAGLVRRREAESVLFHSSGGEEGMHTLKAAAWWTNRQLPPGPPGTIKLATDFDVEAIAYDIDVTLAPGAGTLTLLNGDGSEAGAVKAGGSAVVRVFASNDHTCQFRVDQALTVRALALAGYLN